MKNSNRLTTLMLLLLGICLGCSAITDFDESSDGGSVELLYSINDNLVPPATINLAGNLGTLDLLMSAPLPTPETDDNELLALLDNQTIEVEVQNELNVTHNLTEGTRVTATPANPGEYTATVNAARNTISITFFNEINGSSLSPGTGKYTATITVFANAYFQPQEFVVPVVVQ